MNGQTAQNNQIVGSAFEKAVGQIFGLPKNTVLFNSSVRQSSVIPDFTAKLLVFTYSKDEVKFSDFYVHGIFIEAKTSKSVGLDGSTPGQMKAMVDACANQISYKRKQLFSFISFRCLESGENRRIKKQKYKRNSTGVFFYTN